MLITIIKKNVAKLNKKTAKKNKKFKRATISEKRILIAKDVIQQLKSKNFEATVGRYIDRGGTYGNISDIVTNNSQHSDFQLRDLIPDQCQCCALGAAAICAVKRYNHYNVERANDAYYNENNADAAITNDMLSKYFTESQRGLIEAAFEVHRTFGDYEYGDFAKDRLSTGEEWDRAKKFGKRFKNPTNRMIAIYQNIIDNNGIFIP